MKTTCRMISCQIVIDNKSQHLVVLRSISSKKSRSSSYRSCTTIFPIHFQNNNIAVFKRRNLGLHWEKKGLFNWVKWWPYFYAFWPLQWICFLFDLRMGWKTNNQNPPPSPAFIRPVKLYFTIKYILKKLQENVCRGRNWSPLHFYHWGNLSR